MTKTKFKVTRDHFIHEKETYMKNADIQLEECFDTMCLESLGIISRVGMIYNGDTANNRGVITEKDAYARYNQVQEEFVANSQKILDENHKKAMDEIAKQEELAKQKAK